MANIKQAYGTSTALSLSPASLANAGLRGSAVVSNASDLFTDILISGKVTTGGSPAAGSFIAIYAYSAIDGSTTYTGGVSGTDTTETSTLDAAEEGNLILVGIVNTDATANQTFEFGQWSLARAFGGAIPQAWGLVLKNSSGGTLHATAGNHAFYYQGVYHTVA